MLKDEDDADTLQEVDLASQQGYTAAPTESGMMTLETDAVHTTLIDAPDGEVLTVRKFPSPTKRRVGYVLIILVVILWSTSSFITQLLEEEKVTAFMVTLYSTCLLSLLLPYAALYDRVTGERVDWATKRSIAYASAKVLPLWYAANVLFNLSLCKTSVAASTVVSSTSSAFCLIIGGCYGIEKVNLFKILGVLMSFAGVVFIAMSDKSAEKDANVSKDNGCATQGDYFGDIISLLSALFYALYTLCIRFSFPDQDDVRVDYLFGFLGALSMIVSVPYAIYQFGFAHVSLTSAAVGWLVLNAIVNNLLSDLFWAKAVLWTTPTVVTVGLSMNIPLSVVLDVIINKVSLHLTAAFGGTLIVLGFFMVTKGS